MEVVEVSGAVRHVTLGVSVSVVTESVANTSSWGTVPPGASCAQADLGEYEASQVPPSWSNPTLGPGNPTRGRGRGSGPGPGPGHGPGSDPGCYPTR